MMIESAGSETASIEYEGNAGDCSHEYLVPAALEMIRGLFGEAKISVADIGCGSGFVTAALAKVGHIVIGIDASQSGIRIARETHPELRFEQSSVYDDGLPQLFGQAVDCVISLEVIEHLIRPRALFEQAARILRPGGYLIVSTPYHGFLKNLALSLTDGWDRHFSVDWEGGHVKFFSRRTLIAMGEASGFLVTEFRGAGRLPFLWRSMIVAFRKAE